MYESQDSKVRLLSIKKEENNLKVKSIQYIDDALNEYEEKESTIENYIPGDLITIE